MKANDQQMKLRSEKHHSDSLEKNKRPGSVRFFDMIEKIIKNADGSSNVRGFPVCGGRFSPFPDLQHRESILKRDPHMIIAKIFLSISPFYKIK